MDQLLVLAEILGHVLLIQIVEALLKLLVDSLLESLFELCGVLMAFVKEVVEVTQAEVLLLWEELLLESVDRVLEKELSLLFQVIVIKLVAIELLKSVHGIIEESVVLELDLLVGVHVSISVLVDEILKHCLLLEILDHWIVRINLVHRDSASVVWRVLVALFLV